MNFFTHKIWDQILDGRDKWRVPEVTAAACDEFEVQVVLPLRELRDMGRITIEEVKAPAPGRLRTVEVWLGEVLRFWE